MGHVVCAIFFFRSEQYQEVFLRRVRHGARPCIMWWVQFLVIFDNSVEFRGIEHGRVTCGGFCATKLNFKYEHPNIGIRS